MGDKFGRAFVDRFCIDYPVKYGGCTAMTTSSSDTLAQQVLQTLKRLDATAEDQGRNVDEIFKAGILPFGQLNIGLLALTEGRAVKRVERNNVSYYHISEETE